MRQRWLLNIFSSLPTILVSTVLLILRKCLNLNFKGNNFLWKSSVSFTFGLIIDQSITVLFVKLIQYRESSKKFRIFSAKTVKKFQQNKKNPLISKPLYVTCIERGEEHLGWTENVSNPDKRLKIIFFLLHFLLINKWIYLKKCHAM